MKRLALLLPLFFVLGCVAGSGARPVPAVAPAPAHLLGSNYPSNLGGDVVGAPNATSVVSLSGSSGTVGVSASTLQWAASVTVPKVAQAQGSGGASPAAGQPLAIQAQAGQTATGTANNANGGLLSLSAGAAGTGGSGTAGQPGQIELILPGIGVADEVYDDSNTHWQSNTGHLLYIASNAAPMIVTSTTMTLDPTTELDAYVNSTRFAKFSEASSDFLDLGAAGSQLQIVPTKLTFPDGTILGETNPGITFAINSNVGNLDFNEPLNGNIVFGTSGSGGIYYDATNTFWRDPSANIALSMVANGTGASSLFFSSTTTATFYQSALTSDSATHNLTVQAQNAYASAVTNLTGGTLILQAGAGATTNGTPGTVVVNVPLPSGTGTEGAFVYKRNGSELVRLRYNASLPITGSAGVEWVNATSTGISFTAGNNPLIFDSGTATTYYEANGVNWYNSSLSGLMHLGNGLVVGGVAEDFGGGLKVLQLDSGTAPTSNPSTSGNSILWSDTLGVGIANAAGLRFASFSTARIGQDSAALNVAPTTFTIQSQSANSSSTSNKNGADLLLEGGNAASGGNNGNVDFAISGTAYAYFGGGTSNPGFYPETDLTGFLGSATDRWSTGHVDSLYINTGVYPETDGVPNLGSVSRKWNFSYLDNVYVYTQLYAGTDDAVPLGGSSNRWSQLWVQNVSVTSAGLGGNASAGTAASAPLKLQSTSLALSSGTVTLSVAQASTPVLVLSGNTTAAETIVFPNVAAEWFIITSSAGSSQAANLTLECGTGSNSRTLTQSSGAYPIGVVVVWCDGSNRLYDNIMAQ